MSTTTDRQTFRDLVADVAARAKARLPEAVNGRVESAVRLVLLHDVTPQEDGTILVGSSTDPCKQYRLVGDTCECQDWRHGKAPGGWCRHRIAAGIHKRVGEVLAREDPQPVVPEVVEPWPDNDPEEGPAPEGLPKRSDFPVPLPEAPASANVRVTICGREVQLTLRDSDETRLLIRLQAVLEYYPAPHQSQSQDRGTAWCPLHEVQMKWNEGKAGRKGWHSHRLTDGTWCKGH